eukprot:COSAG02_NODE_30722_length_546_cov_1.145414_1_plen_139_part_10
MSAKAALLAQLAQKSRCFASAIYREAPPELKAEDEVLLAALKKAVGSRYVAEVLQEAPPELKADKEIMLAALKAAGTEYAPDVLREAPAELRTHTALVRAVLLGPRRSESEPKMLMVGLDLAGKTAILYRLKIGELIVT